MPAFPFAVLAGDTPEGEIGVLSRYVSRVVLLPPDESTAEPVSRHPDMNFAVVGNTLVTHERYYRTARAEIDEICTLGGFRLMLSTMDRGADYPRDIGFNALILNALILNAPILSALTFDGPADPASVCPLAVVGKTGSLSPELLALAEEAGMEQISVKQGYAACSAAVFGSAVHGSALVCTADKGIAEACERLGCTVLRIPQNTGIALPGYDCGFIGGASGYWDGRAFFFGNPLLHPALAPLCTALDARGIEVVPLSEGRLTDRGGIRIFRMAEAGNSCNM